ncbi:hypothetical protein RF11_12304 [Thelohanellus kitauei]|uniref:Uncharacterized protein n=1 Tax=Thelohanellus kitauei TaxID=669202 RepID=A0A0C2MZZ0_THEKT|nr:hypothetical protein RF11_12304 [Thelohanellus kitauei]
MKIDLLVKNIGAKHYRLILENFLNKEYEEITLEELVGFMSTQDYLSRLRSLACRCCFDSTVEERLRDQYILGLRDAELQKEIFYREETKDLENTKSNIDKVHNNVQFKGSVTRLKLANDKYSAPTEADKNKTMIIDTQTTCLRCGNGLHR